MLHSCDAPFQIAKKISSSGRNTDARYCKPREYREWCEGLVAEIGIVIGRFLRIAWELFLVSQGLFSRMIAYRSETTNTQNRQHRASLSYHGSGWGFSIMKRVVASLR